MIDEMSIDNFRYERLSEGYKILGPKDEECNFYELRFPEGTRIIAEDAFSCCDITEVHFPKSVEVIEEDAFSDCSMLRAVDFFSDSRLRKIGDSAFSGAMIEYLFLPKGIREIGDSAFYECKRLKMVNFGELKSLKKIGSEAFSACDSLEGALIPEGVTEIGYEAFSECPSLAYASLPSSLKSIEFDVFSGCSSLSSLEVLVDEMPEEWDEDFAGGVQVKFSSSGGYTPVSFFETKPYPYDETKLLLLRPREYSLEEVVLHPSIVAIEPEAFKEHLRLRSFKAGKELKSIGMRAFYCCAELTEVELYDTYIGPEAFMFSGVKKGILNEIFTEGVYHGSALEEFTVVEGKKPTSILPRMFYNTRIKKLRIPDSVTRIRRSAFEYCVELTELDLNRVELIGKRSFAGCPSLKTVKFPSNQITLEEEAFEGCSSVERLSLGGTKHISERAFEACSSLTELTVEESGVWIESKAFSGVPLKKIVFKKMTYTEVERDIPNWIDSINGKAGDTLTIVCRDKNVVKTKKWNRWT